MNSGIVIESARRPSDMSPGPQKREETPKVVDWRDAEQRHMDAKLRGTWYRCREHGLMQPIGVFTVGTVTYCGDLDCSEAVLLVHSAMRDDPGDTVWTKTVDRKAVRKPTKRARRPSPTAESTKGDDMGKKTATKDARPIREIILEHLRENGATWRQQLLDAVRVERPKCHAAHLGRSLACLVDAGVVRDLDEPHGWYLLVDDASREGGESAPDDAAAEGAKEDEGAAPAPEDSGNGACAGTSDPQAAAATSEDAPLSEKMARPIEDLVGAVGAWQSARLQQLRVQVTLLGGLDEVGYEELLDVSIHLSALDYLNTETLGSLVLRAIRLRLPNA